MPDSEQKSLTDATGVPAEAVTQDGKPTDEIDGLFNTNMAPFRRLADYLGSVKLELKEVRPNRWAVKHKSTETHEAVPDIRMAKIFMHDLAQLFKRHEAMVRRYVKGVEDAATGGIDLMELEGKSE